MDKQTFTDNMKACGYELRFGRNGNITATKGDNTVRLVPLADYGVYIGTPSLKAITSKGTKTYHPINERSSDRQWPSRTAVVDGGQCAK